MDLIFQQVIDAQNTRLTLGVDVWQGQTRVICTLLRNGGELIATYTPVTSDFTHEQSVPFVFNEPCITACIQNLIGPIGDCWQQSNGDYNTFINCLISKKNALSDAVVNCILKCMANPI